MSRKPIKSTSGALRPGDGLELSDYVDPNGNLWITGTVTIAGTAPGGTVSITLPPFTTSLPVNVIGGVTDNLTQIGGTAITLGQKPMAQSLPVVIASNQPPFGVALPTITAGNVPQNATSTAYEASRIAKAAPGVLYGLSGFNSKAQAQFISLFDASLLPANGAVPVLFLFVASTAAFSFDFGSTGRAFYAGIVAANSSTGPTLTIGSADCWFDVQFS